MKTPFSQLTLVGKLAFFSNKTFWTEKIFTKCDLLFLSNMDYTSGAVVALLWCLVAITSASELTFMLDAKDEMCFYEQVKKGEETVIEFQVSTSRHNNNKFLVSQLLLCCCLYYSLSSQS